MRTLKKSVLVGVAAFALATLVPGVALAEDISADLVGTDIQPDATGLATYKVDGGGGGGGGGGRRGGRGLEIAVDGIDITDTVYVLINGDFVAQISIVITHGTCSLETANGDEVPFIESGDVIEIVDGDGNDLLVGVF